MKFQYVRTITVGLSVLLGMGPLSQALANSSSTAIVGLVGFRAQSTTFEDQFLQLMRSQWEKKDNMRMVPDANSARVVSARLNEETEGLRASLQKARIDFQKGKESYNQLNMDEAIRSFHRAVQGFRSGVELLKNNRYLLLSHLYLGISLVVSGRLKEGEKFIREMIVLDSKREIRTLSTKEFSPKIVEMHRKLTKQVLEGSSGRVMIQLQPFDAKIYLNGLLQKTTRVPVLEVPVGEHFIVVERPGYRSYSKRLLVSPGQNQLSINLEEWKVFSPYTLERKNNLIAVESLNRVAKDLLANVLVLGNVKKMPKSNNYQFMGQLYDARYKEFSKIERVIFSSNQLAKASKALTDKLLKNITNNGIVVAGLQGSSKIQSEFTDYAPSPRYDPKPSKPFYQKSWFWIATGSVLAAGAGAYFFLLRDNTGDFNVIDINVSP